MLTPEQMEEAVEAMFRANHNPLAEPSSTELSKLRAALTAALPVIERAVLERAAGAVPDYDSAVAVLSLADEGFTIDKDGNIAWVIP